MNLVSKTTRLCALILITIAVLTSSGITADSSVIELNAIGKIESVYRNRVSMRVLHINGEIDPALAIATGSWISFDLPKEETGKNRRNRRNQVGYGSVVNAVLMGNVATEYEVNADEEKVKTKAPSAIGGPVMLWTAQSVTKVKNANEYLPESEQKSNRKRDRKNRKRDKKEKEPVQVWTQEETVRGKIVHKNKRIYIKEDRMGRKAKGLDVTEDEWYEKLKDYVDQRVVVHGITHRTNISSGTIEIKNLMKVYPK